VFRHELPFDRSSLTRWRQRLGEEQIVALSIGHNLRLVLAGLKALLRLIVLRLLQAFATLSALKSVS